jgi:hypothetical protein
VTVWKVTGPLKPTCAKSNAPLEEVPNTPGT